MSFCICRKPSALVLALALLLLPLPVGSPARVTVRCGRGMELVGLTATRQTTGCPDDRPPTASAPRVAVRGVSAVVATVAGIAATGAGSLGCHAHRCSTPHCSGTAGMAGSKLPSLGGHQHITTSQ